MLPFLYIFAVSDTVLLHMRFHLSKRDIPVSRLRRLTHLCSSTLSVNCEKAEKVTLQ